MHKFATNARQLEVEKRRARVPDSLRCVRLPLSFVSFSLVPLIAALHFAGTSRVAAEEWKGLLSQQLQSQYNCKLERFVIERQVPLGGQLTREGRIQCADGREIDYAQPNILLKFELKLCQPTVC